MPTEQEQQDLQDRVAALRTTITNRLASDLIEHPQIADSLTKRIDDLLEEVITSERAVGPPGDLGLAQLIGLGPQAAASLGETRMPTGVERYDETVASERLVAVADLYYIFQHEQIGVFRVVHKLQELFRAGAIRLSSGAGAYGLYRFDRREVLRYGKRDRLAAYRRAFGYGRAPVPPGARVNTDFHPLFSQFMTSVTRFWRDKRVSDLIRERGFDPSYGSIAEVRRAGLDLRNNVKFASYGHLNVLRVEVMQLLDEAFRILGSDDIRRQFGADNAWDVVEEVLSRYFNAALQTSLRQRMAVSGRSVLRWLAQPHILQTSRAQFEALLLEIAEAAEEWVTSAEALGHVRRARRRSPSPISDNGGMPSPITAG